MTFILPPSRALSSRLVSQPSCLGASRRSCSKLFSRVIFQHNVCYLASFASIKAPTVTSDKFRCRFYATQAGKPKAHTGRVAVPKRKAAKAGNDGSRGSAKTAAPRKKNAAKKPRKKQVTRSKAKAKAPKKRKTTKEARTAARAKKAATQKKKDLKEKALLKSPKSLPATAFTLFFSENLVKGVNITEQARSASAQYKALDPEQMERLNRLARENKAKNEVAHKDWLNEHSPAEIRAANSARRQLTRQAKQAGKKKQFRHLQDERLVKQPRSAYAYFTGERFASGDMKHMSLKEITGLISREWTALSPAEKQPYNDSAAKDKARYIDEHTTVYGTPPPPKKPRSATAA